jgi:quinol monooxygenase YgiN
MPAQHGDPSAKEITMAILMTAEVAGQTEAGYRGMLDALERELKQAPGFVMHTAHPIDGGWRVIEVWQSKAASDAFYAQHVAPKLPPGIRPKRSTQELASLATA